MAGEIIEIFASAPPSLMGLPLIHLGGAAGRVKPTATAFWNRGAHRDLAVWAVWENRADNERIIADVRGFWRKLEHLTKGYYINTDSPDDERRLRETYGDNYAGGTGQGQVRSEESLPAELEHQAVGESLTRRASGLSS